MSFFWREGGTPEGARHAGVTQRVPWRGTLVVLDAAVVGSFGLRVITYIKGSQNQGMLDPELPHARPAA